jgi:hypothetical protein
MFFSIHLHLSYSSAVSASVGVPGQHIWTPSSSVTYSSKSIYDGFFLGAVGFEPVDRIWRMWAPPRCNFFHWLAALNRCWTEDRLARRGLEHPDKCPLCDQRGGDHSTSFSVLCVCKGGLGLTAVYSWYAARITEP